MKEKTAVKRTSSKRAASPTGKRATGAAASKATAKRATRLVVKQASKPKSKAASKAVAKRAAQAMGDILRELRQKRGLTQAQLATEAGLSTRQVNSIESGQRPPYLDEMFPLAEALEVEPWVLTRKLRDTL